VPPEQARLGPLLLADLFLAVGTLDVQVFGVDVDAVAKVREHDPLAVLLGHTEVVQRLLGQPSTLEVGQHLSVFREPFDRHWALRSLVRLVWSALRPVDGDAEKRAGLGHRLSETDATAQAPHVQQVSECLSCREVSTDASLVALQHDLERVSRPAARVSRVILPADDPPSGQKVFAHVRGSFGQQRGQLGRT
jgi:hypothetical protein